MFSQIRSTVCRSAMVTSLLWLSVSANAQLPDHTIRASYITQPTGPNSDFSVKLTLDPPDVDIVEYEIAVGYNNTYGTLLDVIDNTGQPQAGVDYLVGAPEPLAGIGYANTFVPIVMSTLDSDLLSPINLAQLNFRTTATYAHPNFQFYVYVTGRNRAFGAGDEHGGLIAHIDGLWREIPTVYDSLEPMASVTDWSMY